MVEISAITGDNGRLSLNADKNCIGIAAKETLRLMGQAACGVSLTLEKVRCGIGAKWGIIKCNQAAAGVNNRS